MDSPARDFTRGFLVGNGRLGAHLRFERWEERLDLSEESVGDVYIYLYIYVFTYIYIKKKLLRC